MSTSEISATPLAPAHTPHHLRQAEIIRKREAEAIAEGRTAAFRGAIVFWALNQPAFTWSGSHDKSRRISVPYNSGKVLPIEYPAFHGG